ncbi:MAG: hypothetical protein K2X77_32250 [Candidatus Obscuribacterales bacterium]|jgi:membrane protein implicated in regulation of membrane protease activity|nr:hypothetical protein [Candidatus Obscuribacterales bacterium]
MSQLELAYWISTVIGFVYIVGSALLGQLHGGDHGGVHGHTGHGFSDGGDPGDVTVTGGGDPGDIDVSASHGGDPGDVNTNTHHHGSHSSAFADRVAGEEQLGAANARTRRSHSGETFYWKVVSALSPTKISLILFFTGAIGLLTLKAFPWLGIITLIPSLIVGYFLARILLNVLNAFVSKLHASTNFNQDSLVGTVGELVLSIEPGKTGEVILSGRSGRHSAPARAQNSEVEIRKLSKVIVVDCKDGVFYVEPMTEDELR